MKNRPSENKPSVNIFILRRDFIKKLKNFLLIMLAGHLGKRVYYLKESTLKDQINIGKIRGYKFDYLPAHTKKLLEKVKIDTSKTNGIAAFDKSHLGLSVNQERQDFQDRIYQFCLNNENSISLISPMSWSSSWGYSVTELRKLFGIDDKEKKEIHCHIKKEKVLSEQEKKTFFTYLLQALPQAVEKGQDEDVAYRLQSAPFCITDTRANRIGSELKRMLMIHQDEIPDHIYQEIGRQKREKDSILSKRKTWRKKIDPHKNQRRLIKKQRRDFPHKNFMTILKKHSSPDLFNFWIDIRNEREILKRKIQGIHPEKVLFDYYFPPETQVGKKELKDIISELIKKDQPLDLPSIPQGVKISLSSQ